MFKEKREECKFEWSWLGNVELGRPNLGPLTSVAVYRLMQFTLRDVLVKELGPEKAEKIFYEAGERAGRELYKNAITEKSTFDGFVANLQKILKDLNVGILRIEKADLENHTFTIAVAEDLDCSGLPFDDETVCTYDEGFISGILNEHAGKKFTTKEIDCWCTGDRVCRFDVKQTK